MTWTRVDTNLARSRLVDVLRTSCGLSKPAAVGSLVMLWNEMVESGRGGVIHNLSDVWIEDAAGWTGEPGRYAAVIRAHHVSDGKIKDWDEYQGLLEERRQADRLRKKVRRDVERARTEEGTPDDVPRTSDGSPLVTVRNATSSRTTKTTRARAKGKPPAARRDAASDLYAEARDTLAAIRALKRRHDLHGNGSKDYIPRAEVEKLGPAAVRAYDAIGGAERVLETKGEAWGFVLRDFTQAYVHARSSEPADAEVTA